MQNSKWLYFQSRSGMLSLFRLGPDIISTLILPCITWQQLVRQQHISNQWRKIVRSPSVWKNVCIEAAELSWAVETSMGGGERGGTR